MCSSLILIRISEIQPGFSHLLTFSASLSKNHIPVPHNLSLLAFAIDFGAVVFTISKRGVFCKNFSHMSLLQISKPSFIHCDQLKSEIL